MPSSRDAPRSSRRLSGDAAHYEIEELGAIEDIVLKEAGRGNKIVAQ
jgi:hypothetical protein